MDQLIELPISQLKIVTYVRTKYNDDRIMHFALIAEAGGKIDPILINENFEVIDGRHRIRGIDMAGKTTVICRMVPTKPRGQEILDAITANMGGALPPTRSDLVLAISHMLKNNITQSIIIKSLGLPPSYTKKMVESAFSMIARQKESAAVEAVAEGMTTAQAAEQFGMDVEEVRTAIRGRRKADKIVKAFGQPKIKAELSTRYRSVAQHNASMMGKLMDGYVDGECSEKIILFTLDELEKKAKAQLNVVENWRERLENVKKGVAA